MTIFFKKNIVFFIGSIILAGIVWGIPAVRYVQAGDTTYHASLVLPGTAHTFQTTTPPSQTTVVKKTTASATTKSISSTTTTHRHTRRHVVDDDD